MTTWATPEGTRAFAERFRSRGAVPEAYRTLGRTGLMASMVGFGTYRVDDRSGAHKLALRKAVSAGCNLIDTSANYGDGHSELLIGAVMREWSEAEAVRREELVIVSKVGYVQGHNLALLQDAEQAGRPYPETVKYADGCWHSIHPNFIAMQLSMSLERLSLSKIDVYLLHNPEYFLADAIKRQPDANLAELRLHFYDRIRRAFAQLEEEVRAGRIQWYGVSSNTFAAPADHGEATSLAKMLEIARDLGRELYGDPEAHHFAVAQLPFNLIETGAATCPNNQGRTVLELAAAAGIGVLANRPLNAFAANRLVRLADFEIGPSSIDLSSQLAETAALEEGFREEFARGFKATSKLAGQLVFSWADEVAKLDLDRFTMDDWQHVENQVVRPQTMQLFSLIERELKADALEDWASWRNHYWPQLLQLLAVVRGELAVRHQKATSRVAATIDPHLPSAWRGQTLSRRAIGALAHTPGVSSVLVGMRQGRYVDDVMGILDLEPFHAESIWQEQGKTC